MTTEKLSPNDWIAAGFHTLANDGPKALQIKILAERLKATKGSFYWHFKDLPAFKGAILETWKAKVATEVIEEVVLNKTPEEQFKALIEYAARPAPEKFGGAKIEPALRAWALSDPDVAQMLNEIDDTRLQFIAQLLKQLGHQNDALPPLFYAAYIGLDDLCSKGKADIKASLTALASAINASG